MIQYPVRGFCAMQRSQRLAHLIRERPQASIQIRPEPFLHCSTFPFHVLLVVVIHTGAHIGIHLIKQRGKFLRQAILRQHIRRDFREEDHQCLQQPPERQACRARVLPRVIAGIMPGQRVRSVRIHKRRLVKRVGILHQFFYQLCIEGTITSPALLRIRDGIDHAKERLRAAALRARSSVPGAIGLAQKALEHLHHIPPCKVVAVVPAHCQKYSVQQIMRVPVLVVEHEQPLDLFIRQMENRGHFVDLALRANTAFRIAAVQHRDPCRIMQRANIRRFFQPPGNLTADRCRPSPRMVQLLEIRAVQPFQNFRIMGLQCAADAEAGRHHRSPIRQRFQQIFCIHQHRVFVIPRLFDPLVQLPLRFARLGHHVVFHFVDLL